MNALRSTGARLARFARFGAIGATATAVNAATLFVFVEVLGMRASLGAVAAFCCAFSVSYIGHYYVTFRSAAPHARALPGFAVAAIVGLVANFTIFALATDVFGVDYRISFIATLLVATPLVYVIAGRFGFDPKTASKREPTRP